MDWSEILNNPELREKLSQMADKWSGKSAEDSAKVFGKDASLAEKLIPETSGKSAADSAKILEAQPPDSDFIPRGQPSTAEQSANTFGKDPTLSEQLTPQDSGKSAADSADVINNSQNFEMVGDPQGGNPNFQLQNHPPSGNVPAIYEHPMSPMQPEEPGALSSVDSPERDVTDTNGAPAEDVAKTGRLTAKQKIALGAGTLGVAGLGTAAVMSGENTPAQHGASGSWAGNGDDKKLASSPDDDADEEKYIGKLLDGEPKRSVSSDDEDAAAVDKLLDGDDEAAAQDNTKDLASELNFGEGGESKQSDLAKLLQQQQEQVKQINHRRDMMQIASGIAKVDPTPFLQQYDRKVQETGLPIQQYLLKNKYEAEDPNSGLSKGMRDYLKTLGINVAPTATASHIQSILPYIFKDKEAKQAQDARHEDVQARAADMRMRHQDSMTQTAAMRELARSDKLQKQGNDNFKNVVSQAESVRGNKAIQNDMETIRRVQNAMNVIKLYKNPDAIPTNIINMLNTDLATIIGGGQAGEGLIHEVSTPTWQGRISNQYQQFANHPTGAKAAAFVQQNQNIFNQLATDADGRLHDRLRRIGNTMGRSLSPDQRESYRQEYLPNDSMDNSGRFMPLGAAKKQGTSTPVPTSWAPSIDEELQRRGER